MDLTHRVRVPAPLDEAWATVNDPARVAAVLPGTTLDTAADDGFTGSMKIKLGSSLLALTGSGRYTSRSEGAHRVVVTTTGTDRRGDAGVEATHTITLAGVGDGRAETDVTVATSMTWSGRPGRLGDGVVADAVDRVLDLTGTRVAARVAEGLPWAPAAGTVSAHDDEQTAAAVVDHPVELGDDLGSIDEPEPGGHPRPQPSPSPGPSPRPPRTSTPSASTPRPYVYQPYSNTAEPHVSVARTLSQLATSRVLPYAGLGALALFLGASALRRARR
ncbi:SRPBCC domain-containing protein [Microlunatus antarcticus]|uniref:Carbon monoxide dehydrogenase subunit G n=1 Tax=Microlunatus antarcticus TaxID=53388 RepID=A0A7W5JWB0_9ACTN|nr:SRPBCC domain-containing protein [Microlunatus antarcticus]MBB3327511.1 carbon monoxide dehydrogenase subunit G [Microlunatus antarcticus]